MKNFNFDDFKKWFEEQEQMDHCKKNYFVSGDFVKSKISLKKLSHKIKNEQGNLKEICKEFNKVGGEVIEVHEHYLVIETNSGFFSINKSHVTLD